MSKLEATNGLKGDYGEIVFEHFCKENNYAYITLEEIYNTLTPKNILRFRYHRARIPVKIPDDIVEEVRRICKPLNNNDDKPYFVYDYLTVSLRRFNNINGKKVQTERVGIGSFNWVEIKTGKARLSRNQIEAKDKISLPLCVFRIKTEIANKIEIDWHIEKG